MPDPTDRRATIIEITDGVADVEQRYQDYRGAVATAFARLDERDRAEFLRICTEITARLRASD